MCWGVRVFAIRNCYTEPDSTGGLGGINVVGILATSFLQDVSVEKNAAPTTVNKKFFFMI
jgi:hypothetical protein